MSRLSTAEAESLVLHGFEAELKYSIDKSFKPDLIKHILWVSDRIPQSLQEYCLELALIAEVDRKIELTMLEAADKKWLRSSLTSAYAAVESQLNERDTKLQRRNQVLYALGQLDIGEFKAQHIEDAVRQRFYENNSLMAIGGIPNALGELVSGKAILKRTPKGDAYMFVDPQYKMAIRAMLRLDEKQMVEKLPLDQI